MIKKGLLIIIRVYQATLSFDHGILKVFKPQGQCKFYPTCSDYTYQAVEKYGPLKGLGMGAKRLSHCHPWTEGGYDPVK